MDSSITHEKAAKICSDWLAKIFRSWSTEVKIEVIANSAFNCVWREDHLDGSPINAIDDCIAWLRHIYWNDEEYPYKGKCDPKKPVLQFSFYDDSESSVSSTESSTSTTVTTTSSFSQNPRLYYDDELEMLEDLLTEMTKEPINVEVSMELVSLNSIDLADSSMDTTTVLFFSWNGRSFMSTIIQHYLLIRKIFSDPRLSWNRTEYGNTQRIVVDPDLIWTPPIEIVNLDHYGNYGIVKATLLRLLYSCFR